MPSPTPVAHVDGLSLVRQGMNCGVWPRLLPKDQVAFAVNCTFRGGLPKTRPLWRKVPLVYASEGVETAAREALFQEAAFYQAVGQGESCLVASVGGRVFRYLVGSSNMVQELTGTDVNDPGNPDGWMWQAEDFLIIQDGQAYPYFFDGAGLRRSAGPPGEELGPGCMGVYVQGRVWQALPNRQAFIAGDLVYSHGFADGYGGRSAVLKTEENTFLSGGGAFGVPITAGRINAMSSVAIADTSLGQGPLQVLTRSSVFSVQVPLLREDWAVVQYPLMTIGLPGYGALSQWATVTVNGDLWYRSADGLRSYQVARRDFNTWVNTPLSVEMEKVLARDVGQYLDKASGVLFGNRLLMTCAPYKVLERGTVHRGLVALDFNNISTLTSRSQPVYDGLWTGVPVFKVLKGTFRGTERCFAFTLACDGGIDLWELLPDEMGYFDWNGTDWIGVESALETRSMGWRDNGNQLKRLACADLYLDRLAGAGDGTMGFQAKYRSDEDPIWKDWHEWELCAPIQDCATDGCPEFQDVKEQYRTYLRLPDPADTPCSEVTGRSPRTGYEFQVRLWWKGFVQWNRVHAWAYDLSDSVRQGCPTSETCTLLKGCDEEWFSYDARNCSPAGPVGIVEEPLSPWISMEGAPGDPNVPILRTEDQPQWPPTPPVIGPVRPPPVAVGEPTPVTPPPDTPPSWPVPDAYPCPGQAYSLDPLQIYDPVAGEARYVGINPGTLDPNTYMLAAYSTATEGQQALQEWATAVWNAFVATGQAYTSARVVWYNLPTSGEGWQGTVVFPAQVGGYGPPVLALDYKMIVEFCY